MKITKKIRFAETFVDRCHNIEDENDQDLYQIHSLFASIPYPRSDDSVKNIEHNGRLILRSNDSQLKIDFVPHQCGKKCVADFPYETSDIKSKQNEIYFDVVMT